jgi:nucleoside 2-deoxyribosyltransferase
VIRIYLAGPDVFLPDAEEQGERKKALCQKYGYEGVFPLDSDLDPDAYPDPRRFGMAIYHGNLRLIGSCNLVIANLTPFRGPSADVGTVFEMALALGRGMQIMGYSNDPRPFAERSREFVKKCGLKNQTTFEDFGLRDNLMIDGALDTAGWPMVVPKVPVQDLGRDLTAFEECLRLVRPI